MGREVLTLVVAGVKRIGKSNETLRLMVEEYIVPKGRKKARKALIVDINNEYGQYKIYSSRVPYGLTPRSDENGTFYIPRIRRIAIKDIIKFSDPYYPAEIRRVVPKINDNGTFANNDELIANIVKILNDFRGGAMLMEDLNSVFGDSLPIEISGILTNNAHRDCDLIMHVQSIGRLLPKMRQNTNIVRMHFQLDSVDESRDKLKEHYEIFKIAQLIVNTQYYGGNRRYFVWIDRDNFKIRGNINEFQIESAIREYISVTPSTMKALLVKKDDNGKGVYTYPQALKLKIKDLWSKYF